MFFDPATSKHRLDVEFSGDVRRLLEGTSGDEQNRNELEEVVREDAAAGREDDSGKKPEGSRTSLAAVFDHSVTVE